MKMIGVIIPTTELRIDPDSNSGVCVYVAYRLR